MGFYKLLYAIVLRVLDLIKIYITINSDFRLFKKNILNAKFYNKKPLITY